MRQRSLPLTLCLALVLLVTACAPPAPVIVSAARLPAAEFQPVSDTVRSDFMARNNRFAFRLFAELAQEDAGKNVFISPASIAMALAMTYNGAKGATQEAMAQTLELQGLSIEDVNRANAELLRALAGDSKVTLNIADSLWARKGVPFDPGFIAANEDYYGAQLSTLDFAHGPDPINAWVKEQTKGRIESIIDRIDPQAVLYLLNAVYFKGPWTEPFNSQRTEQGVFHLAGGDELTLPMMSQGGHFLYLETPAFQAISLPFGDDGRYSFYVFLPAESSSLDQLQSELTAENWEAWVEQFSGQQGSITLPRFQIAYEASLKEALSALGMDIAFDQHRADLHGIVPITEPVWIGDVKHKAFLKINEEGAEAAAATAVEIRAGAAMPQEPPFNMVVDRPFFCAIRDNQTGTLLFMGTVTQPQE